MMSHHTSRMFGIYAFSEFSQPELLVKIAEQLNLPLYIEDSVLINSSKNNERLLQIGQSNVKIFAQRSQADLEDIVVQLCQLNFRYDRYFAGRLVFTYQEIQPLMAGMYQLYYQGRLFTRLYIASLDSLDQLKERCQQVLDNYNRYYRTEISSDQLKVYLEGFEYYPIQRLW